jgi:hypothetical protein
MMDLLGALQERVYGEAAWCTLQQSLYYQVDKEMNVIEYIPGKCLPEDIGGTLPR